MANLEKWHPAQHVVTESLSGAIVTQTIVCHGPSHPKLPQPSPGKHTGVAEFVFDGVPSPFLPLGFYISNLFPLLHMQRDRSRGSGNLQRCEL